MFDVSLFDEPPTIVWCFVCEQNVESTVECWKECVT